MVQLYPFPPYYPRRGFQCLYLFASNEGDGMIAKVGKTVDLRIRRSGYKDMALLAYVGPFEEGLHTVEKQLVAHFATLFPRARPRALNNRRTEWFHATDLEAYEAFTQFFRAPIASPSLEHYQPSERSSLHTRHAIPLPPS